MNKLYELQTLIKKISKWKNEGKKIVFTNGCFDILHPGHLDYLIKAKGFGDILIVGLNSDISVKRLKGTSRPILNEQDRAFMLSCLEAVDAVVIFSENTPIKTIEAIKPDIHVKGGDYKEDDLPEAKTVKNNGGKIEIVPFLKGYSTTKIIDKILNT